MNKNLINEYVEIAREKIIDGQFNEALYFYAGVRRLIERTFKYPVSTESHEYLKNLIGEINREYSKCQQVLNLLENFKHAVKQSYVSNCTPESYDQNISIPSLPVHINPIKTIKKVQSVKPLQQPSKVKQPSKKAVIKDYNKYIENPKIAIGDDFVDVIEAEIIDGQMSIQWNDVAGCEEAKDLLKEAVILPSLIPKYFTGIRKPWKGILLIGPPGTGKTLLAKAVASECKCTFFSMSSASLTSKYHGESEKLMKCLFNVARKRSPSIIFLDEIDGLCSQRGAASEHEASRRTKAELLIQMDGINNVDGSVTVIGATNYPWDIDDALRRRLEKRVYIPLPDLRAREELLKLNLKDISLDSQVDISDLAERLEGYSGSDINNVCRDASMMVMRRKFQGMSVEEISKTLDKDLTNPTTHQDFLRSISKISPSVSKSDVCKYENWIKEYGSI